MPDSFRLGKDAKTYHNTATGPTAWATPTWVEIDIVKDATLNLEKGEWDGSRRGSGGWKQSAATMKSASIDLDIVYVPGDAGFAALRDSYLNDTLIDMAVMSGDITVPGNEGLRAEMQVFNLNRDEKLEEGLMIKCTIKPGVSANDPTWMIVPTPP